MWLLLAFIAVPLIEIALFIQVGGFIGMWWTLAIVVATAILGSTLVRSQGRAELQKLRSSFSELRDPSESLANGAMILFSGALLLTPGFFTDVVGFGLLLPPVRRWVYLKMKDRVKIARFEMGPQQQYAQQPVRPRDTVIDGEFTEVDPDRKATHNPSGWTQH